MTRHQNLNFSRPRTPRSETLLQATVFVVIRQKAFHQAQSRFHVWDSSHSFSFVRMLVNDSGYFVCFRFVETGRFAVIPSQKVIIMIKVFRAKFCESLTWKAQCLYVWDCAWFYDGRALSVCKAESGSFAQNGCSRPRRCNLPVCGFSVYNSRTYMRWRRQVRSTLLKESHANGAMLMPVTLFAQRSGGARDCFRLDSSSFNGETVLFLDVGGKWPMRLGWRADWWAATPHFTSQARKGKYVRVVAIK